MVEKFSRLGKPSNGVWLENGIIYRNGRRIMPADDIKIPGVHNIENYMAAACATEGLATDADVDAVARSFGGVEHRIELVRELHGVKYYNDSIASVSYTHLDVYKRQSLRWRMRWGTRFTPICPTRPSRSFTRTM